jgi:A/G-specific adenine glycosylase
MQEAHLELGERIEVRRSQRDGPLDREMRVVEPDLARQRVAARSRPERRLGTDGGVERLAGASTSRAAGFGHGLPFPTVDRRQGYPPSTPSAVVGDGSVAMPAPSTAAAISVALLDWYALRARSLPIRAAGDPWAILVAEVMSQQTQIARVGAHWVRFMAAYPTPASLAEAPLREVILAWAGLGYNRRAVALRDAARAILERHAGRVPSTVAELDALPGVGPYTARAVAALAFGVPVAAVDVNVRRLAERLAGATLSPTAAQAAADGLVDRERPGDWIHAAMDLAATVCRRRAPACDECPLTAWCASRGTPGEQARPRSPATPFPETRRWLRGRLLAEIARGGDGWMTVEGPRGEHDGAAVREALAGLEADGLVVTDGASRVRIG